jgi:hypothetical protein
MYLSIDRFMGGTSTSSKRISGETGTAKVARAVHMCACLPARPAWNHAPNLLTSHTSTQEYRNGTDALLISQSC